MRTLLSNSLHGGLVSQASTYALQSVEVWIERGLQIDHISGPGMGTCDPRDLRGGQSYVDVHALKESIAPQGSNMQSASKHAGTPAPSGCTMHKHTCSCVEV